MIITDPQERAARAAAKRQAVLRFLRDELYTTPQVLAELLQCGARATRQTLAALERDDLIKRHNIKIMPQLPPIVIVGITPHGQGMALDIDAGETIRPHYNPERVSLRNLQHTTDLQLLRLRSVNNWRQWINSDRLQINTKGTKKPDAVCLTTKGQRVAIECERHIKSRQRYEVFLSGHLFAIRTQKWARVVIASPDADMASRVRAVLSSITVVTVSGERVKIDDKTRELFTTCTYNDFPNVL